MATSQTNRGPDQAQYATGTRTGTRTAADFTITLGFTPTRIVVRNLTDRITAVHYVDAALDGGNNVKSLKMVAAGTTTYEDCGITVGADGRSFTVDVSVASLETDNDDTVWEAFA